MRRSLVPVLGVALLLCAGCTRVARDVAATLSGGPPSPSAASPPSPSATGASGPPAIVIRTPAAGAKVTSPVRIGGTADVFEGVVTVELVDADGQVLAAIEAHASCGTGCRGTFRTRLAFVTPVRQPGAIQAYEISAKDGSVLHLVRVDVTLVPGV